MKSTAAAVRGNPHMTALEAGGRAPRGDRHRVNGHEVNSPDRDRAIESPTASQWRTALRNAVFGMGLGYGADSACAAQSGEVLELVELHALKRL